MKIIGVGSLCRVPIHAPTPLDGALAGRPGPDSVTKAKVDAWIAALENARFFGHQSPKPKREPVADGLYCGIALEGPQGAHEIRIGFGTIPQEIRRVFDDVHSLAPTQ
jgi:hypothetical protein